jgi:uncharacterized protein (TIGR03083 family)
MAPARPADLGARLLLIERAALLPILRRTPIEAFDRPTVCTGWSVRDVLAHCGSALTRLVEGTMHTFTPELNELDVAARLSWSLEAVVAELERAIAPPRRWWPRPRGSWTVWRSASGSTAGMCVRR